MSVDVTWPPKRPATYRPFGIDLSSYLPASSVPVSAVFTVPPSGVSIYNNQQGVIASGSVKLAYVWLTSGVAGATYNVDAFVTTSDGMGIDICCQLPMETACGS